MGATQPEDVSIALIAGLGNPGPSYEGTRHNVGFDFVRELAQAAGTEFRSEARFHGLTAQATIGQHRIRLLMPSTFMNKSGLAVASLAHFYRIPPDQILVVHDELDIPPGTLRLKQGGGHGGHNGLRDIISSLGNNRDFHRLRIGIGHPGSSDKVTPYVLGRPGKDDHCAIAASIDHAARTLPTLLAGFRNRAVQDMHSFSPAG